MGRKIGKRLFCLGTLLAMMMGVGAQAESTTYDYWDGNVHFMFTAEDMDATTVTPFVGKYYQFQDTEEVARIVYGESNYAVADEDDALTAFVGDRGNLTVSHPRYVAFIDFDSPCSENLFAVIGESGDAYELKHILKNEDQELDFMSRTEAERQAEALVSRLYGHAGFRAVKNFAITQSDYDALCDDRLTETTQGSAGGIQTEDLGYLICMKQYVNDLPIADRWNQGRNHLGVNVAVEIWMLWSPKGCEYIAMGGQGPIQYGEDCIPCQVISREAAMNAFANAYNYVLGAGTKEIWDVQLEWFGSDPTALDEEVTFNPMWCFYTPQVYESVIYSVDCFYVDACTGEVFL